MIQKRRSASWWKGWLVVCSAVILGACVQARPDPDPVVHVWAAPRPLAVVKDCVLKALDDNGRVYSEMSPSVRHVVTVVTPGKVVDVRPVKEHAVVDTNYYVRLEKIHEQITRIAFHSSQEKTKRMIEVLAPCGATP